MWSIWILQRPSTRYHMKGFWTRPVSMELVVRYGCGLKNGYMIRNRWSLFQLDISYQWGASRFGLGPLTISDFYARQHICYSAYMLSAVCPSVRRGEHTKTVEDRIMKLAPSGSPMILVFWRQISSPNSKGFPRTGASKKGGVRQIGQFSDFLALSVNISSESQIIVNIS